MKGIDIERESFRIITEELGERTFAPGAAPIVKRVIHATADFDFAETLVFSPRAVEIACDALRAGTTIVTDTQMARSGINKTIASRLGCAVECFMSDDDVAEAAKKHGTTRAHAAIDKAIEKFGGEMVFVCGNAPTSLIHLCEIMDGGGDVPRSVVGVPVGFVNVELSKEMIIERGVPSIVARGRKGGSTVAAAIVNALLYSISARDEER